MAGVDASGWAVNEARLTLRQLGVPGGASRGDALSLGASDPRAGRLAAFTFNELAPVARERLLERLLGAASAGAPVLVVEPLSRRVSPWWPDWREAFVGAGGREAGWRFRPALPPSLALLGKAAGLDTRELTGRSLSLPAHAPGDS